MNLKISIVFKLSVLTVLLTGCSAGMNASQESATGNSSQGQPGDSTTTRPSTTTTIPSSPAVFINPVTSGTVQVTLHPGSQVVVGQARNIVFGVPFPKGFVNSIDNIRVLNASNQEIPSQVAVINSWRNFSNPVEVQSIRSVRIGINLTFPSITPIAVRVQWGNARTLSIAAPIDLASTWTEIANGPNPTEYPASANVREPMVYATLPAAWMSQCLLKTRMTSLNEITSYSWFDTAFSNFSTQAVNATAHQTTAEPWLYDRSQTIYFAYFRTGDVNWLRRAHRAAQFYKANINASGGFALGGDSKYVYGQSMLYDLILTGDATLVPVIERARAPHAGHPTSFSASTNFWTERNAAYALLASLSAYEATGAASDATRARSLFNSFFSMQQTPINGWIKNGCSLHTNTQHDPSETLPSVVCSPWMGALLSDAVWRYYLVSMDNNALIYLADYADYLQMYALYTQGAYRLSYYGASSYGNTGANGDFEHACDVMGAFVRGYWAKRALQRNASNLTPEVNSLVASCHQNLTSSSLSPARKYSWWFGTNSDFQWFLENLPN